MKFSAVLLAATAAPLVLAHGTHQLKRRGQVKTPELQSRDSTSSAALNPQLTNTIDNLSGPTLYYNGSGPVPSESALSPDPITTVNTDLTGSALTDIFFSSLIGIANGTIFTDSCSQCMQTMEVMHLAAVSMSANATNNLLIQLCETYEDAFYLYAPTCYEEFSGIGNTGPYWVSLFSMMNMSTGDHQAVCSYQFEVCDAPATIEIDESLYFTPKPASAEVAPTPSGEVIEVLHITDWHLDPRYDIGSEANCSQYLCCRNTATNDDLLTTVSNASVPASRWGYLYCDVPPDLALSAFTSMPQFFNVSDVAFSIFTGDIVSHDDDNLLSRDYVEYEEIVTYQTFKAQLGDIPVYPTLGNHDSLPEGYNAPNSWYTNGSNAMSWNYELLSSLWANNSWMDSNATDYASTHYGGYSYVTPEGLKIVSLNTDFWYQANILNYANFSNPDPSGILTYLANELTASEAAGQRVWIIGHVPSGYDGSNALPNPAALFYSIVARFSPSTIAGVFFGHSHEDQKMIYYDFLSNSTTNGTIRDTTAVDFTKPLMVGWIGPSITPLTGNNAGYTRYQVDGQTFSVIDAQVYFANMSEALTWETPQWQYEYDARTTYSNPSTGWPSDAPLNATFWDDAFTRMETNITFEEVYNFYETKSSVVTVPCNTAACQAQKICYVKSGATALTTKLCGATELDGAY